MKKYLSLIYFISLLIFINVHSYSEISVNQEDAKNTFESADKYYKEHKYDEALKLYERLIESSLENPILFYNAGNSYYMQNQKGKAAQMYEKAIKYLARDKDIQYNLQLITPSLNKKQYFFLFIPFVKIYNLLSISEWIILSDIFFACFCLFIGLFYLLRQKTLKTISKVLFSASLTIFIISLCFTLPKFYNEKFVKEMIVIKQEALVMSGPSEEFSLLFRLPECTKVQYISKNNNWIRVKLSNDKEGYLKEDSVGNI